MLHSISRKSRDLLNWEGLFRKRSTEADFQEIQNQTFANRIRVVTALTGSAYIGGFFSDLSSLGGTSYLSTMLTLRILTFLFAMLCFISTFSKQRVKITPWISFIYFMMITLSECTELLLRPELSNQGTPFLGLIIIIYYVFFPIRFSIQITGGIFAAILYTINLSTIDGDFAILFVVAVTFIVVNLLGAYISRFIHVSRRMEYIAVAELMKTNEQLQVEIEERKKAGDRLIKMATIDDLTQIYNRRYFIELVTKELQEAEKATVPTSLLFMDIDYFKRINDTYGHSIGDMVLKKLAGEIGRSISDSDIFGRFGGEEFALLLPGKDLEKARKRAEQICGLVSKMTIPIQQKEKTTEIKTTISIGVVVYEHNSFEDLDTLMKKADSALYKAKESGRNRVMIWSRSNENNSLNNS